MSTRLRAGCGQRAVALRELRGARASTASDARRSGEAPVEADALVDRRGRTPRAGTPRPAGRPGRPGRPTSGSPRASATASRSISAYRSKPTALMLPCCSAPSSEPAPRISRSRMATLMPLPSSVCSRIAVSRSTACSVSDCAAREQEVRVRAHVAAAHAALELVELRETEPLAVLDDEGVACAGCRCRTRRSWSTRARRTRLPRTPP